MTSAGRARELAELSGMVLGATSLPVGTVSIPGGIELDGEDLVYDFLQTPHESSADGLLDSFMSIRTPDDVLRFATRFGVLSLCQEHGLPPGPKPLGITMRSPHDRGCALRGYPQPRERLSGWLAFAAQANSIIELAGHLHDGGNVKPAERVSAWRVLYESRARERSKLDKLAQLLSVNRRLAITFLSEYVNYWLALGGAQPAVIWPPDSRGDPENGAALELRAAGTFGLMAIQLATAVTRAQDIYICAGCKQSYLRTKRPPRSGRNYCLVCKDQKIDGRDRKRRQREKLAGEGQAHAKKRSR